MELLIKIYKWPKLFTVVTHMLLAWITSCGLFKPLWNLRRKRGEDGALTALRMRRGGRREQVLMMENNHTVLHKISFKILLLLNVQIIWPEFNN